ncbi:lactate racemase domain-containing protein, partial [Chloroflexota bacterium]
RNAMVDIVPVEEGAEAFVELLNANDVDYIFFNPGTASVSIQEALSKFSALGKRVPRVMLGLHEFVAMSCDLKISIGGILPHVSYGFSGGGKLIIPGVASYETVTAHHSVTHEVWKAEKREQPDKFRRSGNCQNGRTRYAYKHNPQRIRRDIGHLRRRPEACL